MFVLYANHDNSVSFVAFLSIVIILLWSLTVSFVSDEYSQLPQISSVKRQIAQSVVGVLLLQFFSHKSCICLISDVAVPVSLGVIWVLSYPYNFMYMSPLVDVGMRCWAVNIS